MNTAAASTGGAAARAQRVALARELLHKAPQAAAALDWDALSRAPGWLALPEAERAHFTRRVGSVMLAPALRLWISAPRVAAAREAVGADWWAALQLHNDWPALPNGMATWPDGGDAAGVGELMRMAGASVLQALLPHGALRHAAAALLAPAAPFVMPSQQAQAVVQATWALAQGLVPR